MTTPSTSASSAAAATPSSRPARWLGDWWVSLLVLAAVVLFFAPVYARHVRLSADSSWYNDDARQQIWPFYSSFDNRLFHDDYIADYYRACFPIGFRTLYTAYSSIWNPAHLSKGLPYLLLAITVFTAARAARRLRGPAAGWAAAALCLGATLYLQRMAGGLPRAFAFPLLAMQALALARGRPIMLGIVTALSAAFYPAAAVVGGLMLAVWMLALPGKWRGNAEHWGIARRVIVLTLAAGLTVLAILPSYFSSAEYGPLLHASDQAEYPELSPAGRYQAEDRADDSFSMRAMKNFIEAPLAGIGGNWDPSHAGLRFNLRQCLLMALAAGGIVGFALLSRTSFTARRVAMLPAAALLAYGLSVPLAPLLYLPSRYQLYPLAIAALVIVPAGLAHLSTLIVQHVNHRRIQAIALLMTVGLYLFFFSAWQVSNAGLKPSPLASAGLRPLNTTHRQTYGFLRKLRPTSLLAGWPTALDDVPYLTGRSVLVTRENHQAFHRQYAEKMRTRVRAVIDALYDPELVSLQRLRDDFGVTHVLVDRDLYGVNPPTYFAPFDEYITAARARLGKQQPATLREMDRATVNIDENWVVLDLNRLPLTPGR